MTSPRIGVDVSQFFGDPYASGIQRLVLGLAANWASFAEPVFVSHTKNGYRILTPEIVAASISELFKTNEPKNTWKALIKDRLAAQQVIVRRDKLFNSLDAWLLPEVNYTNRFLASFDAAGTSGLVTAAIFCDAFPETDPAAYPQGNGFAQVAQYFRRVAVADVVVSISDYSRSVLIERLRRPVDAVSAIASPGGDHVEARTSAVPASPTFAIISTLEQRKRHDLVIDALVATNNRDIRLVVAGRRSGTSGPIVEAIEAAQKGGFDIEWIEDPTDREIETVYDTATCVFSTGNEGYGISVVEALRQGCPVAYTGIQPSGDLCKKIGAYSLASPTRDALATFMNSASNPAFAATLRSRVLPNQVPTWKDFTNDVVEPIADAIRRKR